MSKAKVATVWLDGCSGCHMSFLDIDDALIDLAAKIDLVYSPLVDNKTFPDQVDVTLVEGAVASEEDLEKIRHIRRHTKVLVVLGDCAITGNVPAMRNTCGLEPALERAFVENADRNGHPPSEYLPKLLERVTPVHEAVKVDVYIPGCPPPAPVILYAVGELLEGRIPDLMGRTRFGK